MAVVNCRECSKTVSTEAASCPHCGVPNPAPKNEPSTGKKVALSPCRSCKAAVPSNASTCPHCGATNPGVTTKDTLIGVGIACALVAVAVYACSDSDADKAKKAAESKAAAEAQAVADAACLTDLQCIGDKGTITAGIKCPSQIEKLAKGAVKWTDGTLEPKFSRFRWKDKTAGVVTHIGDKAQFQNGFGAFINVVYTCDLDMRNSGEVVHVGVSEGRL